MKTLNKGGFNCSFYEELVSLKGCPERIDSEFDYGKKYEIKLFPEKLFNTSIYLKNNTELPSIFQRLVFWKK